MKLRTAEEIEQAIENDAPFREAYGCDWLSIRHCTRFQHGYGYEVPDEIHGWQWSSDFARWSALVTFSDGWHGFTYPDPAEGKYPQTKPEPEPDDERFYQFPAGFAHANGEWLA